MYSHKMNVPYKCTLEEYNKIRKRCYIIAILIGIILTFANPVVARADFLGVEVQDVYALITENVRETNDLLNKSFEFTQVSPYTIVNNIAETSSGEVAIKIRTATKTMALIVATLLMMVEFFRKSVNFEWSSKWENILLFLVKIILVKQVVQNADTIVGYIYAGFKTINDAAVGTSFDFLPYSDPETYVFTDEDNILQKMAKNNWVGLIVDTFKGNYRDKFYYEISEDAVKIFYPDASFPDIALEDRLNLNENPFAQPTDRLFIPCVACGILIFYFLVLKAIACIIFVITIGRVFELAIYTIFAPLPLVTFASDTTHDVAKGFIKNYIATVIQIAAIAIMFVIYVAVEKYVTDLFNGTKLIQIVILISLALSVTKSGAWTRKLLGMG